MIETDKKIIESEIDSALENIVALIGISNAIKIKGIKAILSILANNSYMLGNGFEIGK